MSREIEEVVLDYRYSDLTNPNLSWRNCIGAINIRTRSAVFIDFISALDFPFSLLLCIFILKPAGFLPVYACFSFMVFDAFYFHCARWICGLTSLPGFYVFAFEPPFAPLYLYFLMEPYYSLFQKLTQFSWGPNEIYVTWFALNNREMCTKLAFFLSTMFREKNVEKRSHTLQTAAFNHTASRHTLSA